MTKTKPAESMVQEIPLEQLEASRNNPRRTMDPDELAELVRSIREHGVNVPLLVRAIEPGDGGYFEIVCGHRRSEAASLAGLERVPCIVRDLTDERAAELALIDNLQRVDVPAIEEAEAFNTLLARLGSVAAVAAKVGKEQAYVAKRLRLCTLTTWSQDALRAKLITIDHALLLARLAEDEQNAALRWTLDRHAGSKTPVDRVIAERIAKLNDHGEDEDEDDDTTEEAVERVRWRAWEPETVLRLKEHIECESGIPLSRAPWDLDDATLCEEPACSVCERNTKANAPLFGDLDTGVAVCTDGACFKEKTAAFVRIQAGMSEGTEVPLRVSWKSASMPPRLEKETGKPNPAQVFKYGQWIDVQPKHKCEHARKAVTVDWSDANDRGFMGGSKPRKPGEVLQVCVQPKCKVHRKLYEQQARETRNTESKLTEALAEQREFLQKTEGLVRDAVLTAILEKLDTATAVRMVAHEQRQAAEWRKRLVATFPKIDGERLEALTLFCCAYGRKFEANGYWLLQDCKLHDGYFTANGKRPNVAKDRKEAWELAKRVGLDADLIAVEYFFKNGIAPAADCLYPKSPAAKKHFEQLVAEDRKKRGVKVESKPTKKAAKSSPKKATKKGGRK